MCIVKHNVALKRRSRPLLFAYFLLLLLVLLDSTSTVKWLGLYRERSLQWNSTRTCRKIRESYGLTLEQARLCKRNADTMPYVYEAAAIAVTTCQNLFRYRQWNCSSIKILPKLLPDLAAGTKERAFVHALSAATLTYTTARGCATSAIHSCSCSSHPEDPPNGNFKWGGCGDNILFGSEIAKQFVGVKKNSTKKRSRYNKTYTYYSHQDEQSGDDDSDIVEYNKGLALRIKKHNSEIGMRMVAESLLVHCKCHGVSGSCSLKTCWRGLPLKFNDIGERLMNTYNTAVQVHPLTRPDQLAYRFKDVPSLLYASASPDFCGYNAAAGTFGMTGRECNAIAAAPENCESVCCDRGHVTQEVEQTERCNCKYHWCCYVTCDTCKVKKKISTCN